MTAKDFTIIADIIRTFPEGARAVTAVRFCTRLRNRFPAFKSYLFLKACGLSQAEVAVLQDIE